MANEARNLQSVLSPFGIDPARSEITPVTGGFSGAGVWRVRHGGHEFALKRWPATVAHLSLEAIHPLMRTARNAGLSFVPEVQTTRHGQTVAFTEDRVWDLCTWMPGEPVEAIQREQLRAAVRALSQLHAAWHSAAACQGVSTAVELQLSRLSSWTAGDLQALRHALGDEPLYLRAYHAWMPRRERAIQMLRPWSQRKLPLQMCLGDVWSSHVLFREHVVTGIIDYGGMRPDHPAQDLARLLGSYSLSAAERMTGLEAYPPRTAELDDLVTLLIQTGRVTSLGNWLRWLILERRTFADPEAVRKRLERLTLQCEVEPIY